VPVYVAISPISGEIYVSDRMTSTVYVYTSAGKYSRIFTPTGEPVGRWAPLGLAFDADGRLYVTDVRSSGGHRVLVFGADGALQRTFSPPGGLLYPNGIAVDSFGHIEVSDSNNARVMVFAADGQVLGRIVSGMGDDTLGLPRGIAVDDANRLYVVDAVNHGVRMYKVTASRTLMPTFSTAFGAEGTVDGAFEYPNGIATDSHARIYVTDRENNRVQVWGY
jgi:DNA-binding beta-propeller fold protein YncE